MKTFILKIIIFLVPVILFMLSAEYYLTNNLKKSHNIPAEIEVWNDIYEGNLNSDIAIYGSSRAWVHIDPNIIKDSLNMNAYNFGVDGHNFWLQYLRHKEFIKHNKQPKLIIMSVDVFSLAKRKDLYEINQFLPYMLWNENIIKFTSSYEGFNFEDYYLPFVRYYGRIRGAHSVLKSTLDKELYRNNGFKGIESNWDKDKAKLKKNNYSIVIDPNSIDLFEQFLIECKANNTNIILVYTPEHIEGQKFVKNRQQIIDVFSDFSEQYNLLFLDYSDDKMCENKEFFYNASHLNKKGAELFTSKLSHDIKVNTRNKKKASL